MAITPSDFSKIWASNADTPEYTFNEADYLKGWDFVGNLPPTRAQWNAMQKSTDEKMKYVFDNFGAPLTASTVAGMTMQNRVYVYTGSETGYTAGHWYYYDAGTSTWVDGGVYNAVAIVTDTTLTQAGVPADAKATGEKISLLKNGNYAPSLEVGSYNVSGNQPIKVLTKYRVRTESVLSLKKGDMLSISDTTIGRFSLIASDDNGVTYKSLGWMIQPYTAPNDQLVAVVLALQTENTSAVYTDPSDIGFTIGGYSVSNIDNSFSDLTASKNLFDAKWINAYIGKSNGVLTEYKTGLTGIAERDYIPVESSTEYTLSWYGIQVDARIYVIEYASDKSFVQTDSYSTGTIGGLTETHVYHITTAATTKFLRFYILRASYPIAQFTPTLFQLEKGTVATDPVDSTIVKPSMIDYDAGRKRLIDYGVVLNDFYLPDYYFVNNYIQNKVTRINTLLGGCANNGDAYVFITDEHWVYNQKKSPALLRYITEHCNILKLMDGGDNADNGSLDFCKAIELAWKKQGGEIYHTAGNHEFFNHTPQATICYYFDMFHDRPYHGNADKLYYYFDNERQKIRYVVCAGYYESDVGNVMNGFYLDADQRAWLRDVALNVDSTWNVVVFTHDFWTINLQTDAIKKLGQSTDTLAILDAHNTDATKGKILFIQQGHTHRDRITYTDGGIPLVMTTCDKNQISMINGYPDISPAVDRTSGTINEQAFDVVVINKTLKKATFVRIGGKAQDGINDSPGNLAEEREISWT